MPSDKDDAVQDVEPVAEMPTETMRAAAHVRGAAEARAEIDEAAAAEAEASAEGAPAAPERTYPEKHEHYTIGLWKSVPNYVCNECTYARTTRNHAEGVRLVMSHWVEVHSPDANYEMVPTGMVDQQGRPITRRLERRRR